MKAVKVAISLTPSATPPITVFKRWIGDYLVWLDKAAPDEPYWCITQKDGSRSREFFGVGMSQDRESSSRLIYLVAGKWRFRIGW